MEKIKYSNKRLYIVLAILACSFSWLLGMLTYNMFLLDNSSYKRIINYQSSIISAYDVYYKNTENLLDSIFEHSYQEFADITAESDTYMYYENAVENLESTKRDPHYLIEDLNSK